MAAVKVARRPPQSLSGGPHHHVQCSLLTLLSHSILISLLSLTFQEEMSVESNKNGCECIGIWNDESGSKYTLISRIILS